MTRVDPVTADKVRQVLQSARARGADAAVALDQAGLLDYPGKRRQCRINAIDTLVQSTTSVSADVIFPNRLPRTPLDLKQEVIKYLEHVRDGLIRHGNTDK